MLKPGWVYVEVYQGYQLRAARCTERRAKDRGYSIITCCNCKKPAARIPRDFPAMPEEWLCAEHAKEYDEAWAAIVKEREA